MSENTVVGKKKGVSSFASAKKKYDDSLEHPDFYFRANGIQLLANCRDNRAFEILINRYFHPADMDSFEYPYKYIIAGICGKAFTKAENVDLWIEWAKKAASKPDCWVHYYCWQFVSRHRDSKMALKVIRSDAVNIYTRAATLEGLGKEKPTEVYPLVTEILGDRKMVGKGTQRTLFIEACANVLVSGKGTKTEPYLEALRAVIKQLDNKKNTKRNEKVIARRLANIFDSDVLYLESKPWLSLLDGKEVKVKSARKRYKTPEFLGVGSTGNRIAFLIDLSDSMLKPLTQKEIEDMKRAITGRHKNKGPKEEAKNPEEERNDLEEKLDWSKIKTRFDAARESLIISLQELQPKMKFTVIGFGTEATWLNVTRGLVPANQSNIKRAVDELKRIKPGAPRAGVKTKSLRGMTNIHGAFLCAYRSLDGKVYKEFDEHVVEAGFEEGCDTIFILTDGAATTDDYTENGIVREHKAGTHRDPETGELRKHKGGKGSYPIRGPYRLKGHYVQDILRMTLLRKAEIHTVGIGEADYVSLKNIADIGLGTFTSIGQ